MHQPFALATGLSVILTFSLAASGPAVAQAEQPRAVSALGRIEPRGGIIRVGAPSTPEAVSGAILKKLWVSEGDRVEAGQLLAETDAGSVVQAMVEKAQAELDLAVIAAEAAQSKADEACVLAQVAASEAERRTDLLARKLASREETEQAEGVAQARQASCSAARATARVANSTIEVARASLRVAEAELQRTRITAPTKGMIIDLIVEPGELIGAEGVLELGRVDQMVATAEVYETDIGRVSVGQRAEISSDALTGVLSGRVTSIALKVHKQDEIGTDPAARKDARIIEAEVLLDDPQAVSRLTNLQVEVIIYP